MIFEKTDLEGAYVITPKPFSDERGFFARIICENEFTENGLSNNWVQQNISFNYKKGTLRGMHFQKGDAAEIKMVRCTSGAIYDVIVDLRKDSPTYLKWIGVELSKQNHKMLYIPENFAHGYITLTDDTEISYMVSAFYAPKLEGGLRYNDPKVNINWPIKPEVISEKDKSWPYLGEVI